MFPHFTQWGSVEDFCLELTLHGHRVTQWEVGLLEAALHGSLEDRVRKRDTPTGLLFRRHFEQRAARCRCPLCRDDR